MIDPWLDADYLQAQYERLRAEGLQGSSGERGHGLALLIGRGMVTWMKALSTLAPGSERSAPSTSPHWAEGGVEIPEAARSELTAVLATLVLGCRQGGQP